jgi:hypothetical protein
MYKFWGWIVIYWHCPISNILFNKSLQRKYGEPTFVHEVFTFYVERKTSMVYLYLKHAVSIANRASGRNSKEVSSPAANILKSCSIIDLFAQKQAPFSNIMKTKNSSSHPDQTNIAINRFKMAERINWHSV